MKNFILNADDFGRHELINKAVEIGAREGLLRSATIMPGGDAFLDAVSVAKRNVNLGVGIHFTLVNGNPILPRSEIPSLIDKDGKFYDDYKIFTQRFFSGKINLAEVRRELCAQLEKVEQTGLRLTHADSHQHMHTLPKIIDIVIDLVKQSAIKAIRTPKTPLFAGEFGGVGQLIGRIGLGTLARLAEVKIRRAGLKTPEHFLGIVAGNAVTVSDMLIFAEKSQTGTTEIMLHPGTDNDILIPETSWQHDFKAELAAVTAGAVLEKFKAENINAVNYEALY